MSYPTGKKVAIIDADTASLAAGAHLALLGHKPVVFTAQSEVRPASRPEFRHLKENNPTRERGGGVKFWRA